MTEAAAGTQPWHTDRWLSADRNQPVSLLDGEQTELALAAFVRT